jgi:signal transduction histidine kinase
MEEPVDTYFAPAERADTDTLKKEIASVACNPIIHELLNSISGLIAVLDEHRQVIALNDYLLRMLGIEDPGAVLGLRLGEVLACVHCKEEPAGCGTTKYCSTCGAAIAITSTLAHSKPEERICAVTAKRGEVVAEFSLLVKANPLTIEGRSFVLLFLQDITIEELRAALERTFFHDMGNMLTGLLGVSRLLDSSPNDHMLVNVLQQSALRLHKEMEVQRCLFKNDISELRVARDETTPRQLRDELKNVFDSHSAGIGKQLDLTAELPQVPIRTDISLALRVMCNMVTNGLEATDVLGKVKAWFEESADALTFCVWNETCIPEEVRYRIFQRSYTTKEGNGRGIGTYSMKLIGEKLLGGKVTFSSSQEDGTVFRFALPKG